MPEHDLLLQINDKVGDILTEMGGLRSDVRSQCARLDGMDENNEHRDRQIEELRRFADDLNKERKIAMWLAGGVSAAMYLALAILSYLFRR